MPALDLLIPFFLATAVFACIPGPGLLYAASRTMAGGQRAGWLAALGLHIGGYAHLVVTALGLAALLEAVPVLYTVVKTAGAIYLMWLGYRMFTSGTAGADPAAVNTFRSPKRALVESIVVELLNPKTALFYLAFLPQFTDLDAAFPIWAQIMVLGLVVNVMFSVTDAACVLLSGKVMRALSASQTTVRLMRRCGGGFLVALGINLAASRS